MSDDRKTVLAAILAVKRGFVSPEEAMRLLQQASESEAELPAEQSLISMAPAPEQSALDREVEELAGDSGKAAAALEAIGISREAQGPLFERGTAGEGEAAQRLEQTLFEIAPSDIQARTDRKRPGLRLDEERYSITREHARGGMGRILLALDNRIGREVALKELLPSRSGSRGVSPFTPGSNTEQQVERFLREAKLTGQLEHPNIVPVYEIGEREDGSLYYTMKFVRGRSMASRIRAIADDDSLTESAKLSARLKLLDRFIDVCNAIAYAHSKRVIHRDLKPDNVMLGDFGETLVLDWGLAKLLGADEPEADAPTRETEAAESGTESAPGTAGGPLTLEGSILGTPAYMPPEQARGEQDQVDELSDVYSLGAMLYEILTGYPPYRGSAGHSVLELVIEQAPEPVGEIAPDAPPELAALSQRAMAREKSQRLGSAKELADQVKAFRDGRLVSVYEYSLLEHLKRFLGRHRAAVSVACLALALLIAGGIYAYTQVRDQRDIAERNADLAEQNAAAAEESAEIARKKEREALENEADAAEALVAARINLAEAHYGYAELAGSKGDFAGRLLQLAAARLQNPESVDVAALLAAKRQRLYPVWQSQPAFVGAKGEFMVFSADRRLVVGPLRANPTTLRGWQRGSYSNPTEVGLWDARTGRLLRRFNCDGELVGAVAISDDGARVAAGGTGEFLFVWDVASGERTHALAQIGSSLSGLAFSRDGRELLAVVKYHAVQRFELVSTGAPAPKAFEDEADSYYSFVVSDDWKRVLVGTVNGNIVQWEIQTGKKIGDVRVARSRITALAIVTAGVLIGCADGTVHLWDAALEKKLREFKCDLGYIYQLTPHPDGRLFLARGAGCTCVLFNLAYTAPIRRFVGRDAQAGGAAFSADGRHLLAVGAELNVWEVDGGKSIRDGSQQTGKVGALAFSPDGSKLASVDAYGRLVIRDAANGDPLIKVDLQGAYRWTADYSPSGDRLVVAGRGGAVILDAETGQTRIEIETDGSGVWEARFSPDGARLGLLDGEYLRIADPVSGKVLSSARVFAGALAFSPDGSRILLGWRSGRLGIWEPGGEEPAPEIGKIHGGVQVLAWSGDGKSVVAGSTQGELALFRVRSPRKMWTIRLEGSQFVRVTFSPDGSRLLSLASDGKLRIHSVNGGKLLRTMPLHKVPPTDMAWTADGRHIATSLPTGEVQVWDLGPIFAARTFSSHAPRLSGVAISQDGRTIASVSVSGRLRVHDLSTGRQLRIMEDQARQLNDVAIHPDGRLVAAGGEGRELLIWEIATGELRRRTKLPGDLLALCYTDEGAGILLSLSDSSIWLWDAATGRLVREYKGHDRAADNLRLLPGKRRFVSAGVGGHLYIWDLDQSEPLAKLPVTQSSISCLDVSGDGRLAITAGRTQDFAIWDLERRAIKHRFKLSLQNPSAVRFLPDGKSFVALGVHGGVRIVDMETGLEVSALRHLRNSGRSCAVTPDGRTVVIGCDEGDLVLLDILGLQTEHRLLHKSSAETILRWAQRVTGRKLVGLGDVPLSEVRDTARWLTDSAEVPPIFSGARPHWYNRLEGEPSAALRDYFRAAGARTAAAFAARAKAWRTRFAPYRGANGRIDFARFESDRRVARDVENIKLYRLASESTERRDWHFASARWSRLTRADPANADAWLNLALVAIELDFGFWARQLLPRASYAANRAGAPLDEAYLSFLFARSGEGSTGWEKGVPAFENARKQGYESQDFFYYFAKYLAYVGFYDRATEVANEGLAFAGSYKVRLEKLLADIARWRILRPGLRGLPAVIVESVDPEGMASAGGVQVGDHIIYFHSPRIFAGGRLIYFPSGVTDRWTYNLSLDLGRDEDHGTLTILRNGERLELKVRAGHLGLEMVGIRAKPK